MPVSADRSAEKRDELRSVAAELFLAHGYEGVSVDDVIERVGGSKTNVYTLFGGKDGLFVAAVESLCRDILRPFAGIDIAGLRLPGALKAFGRAFLDMILAKRTLALHRLVVAEASRFPRLGRLWYAAGLEASYGELAAYLARQQEAGQLKRGDPRRMAALFLDMLAFDVLHRKLLGVTPRSTRQELDRFLDDAVETFLRGNAARRAEPGTKRRGR